MFQDQKPANRRRRTGAIAAGAICGAALFAGAGATAAPPAPPTANADLAVVKTDTPDPVVTGAVLTYKIQVQNLGPDTAPGVVLTDKLPSGTDFVSATSTQGKCAVKGNGLTCAIGELAADGTVPFAAGSSATVTLKVKAPAKPGKISNTATVTGDVIDANKTNDADTEVTTVIAAPGGAPMCNGVEATIVGTSDGESLQGTSGRDVVVARGGDDEVLASGGKDLICAGAGADVVKAGGGNDVVLGGGGRDRLAGQSGNDIVRGQGRGDRLRGGDGNDRLAGGPGRDRCNGGSGTDVVRSCED